MGMFFKKYSWVLYLFLIFLGTYFLAKIASHAIAAKIRVPRQFQAPKVAMVPSRTPTITFEDYRIIMERNIFDSREIEPEAVPETPEPQEVNLEGPAVKTALPIKLISTVCVGDGTDKRSSATVADRGGKADTYSIEDEKQFAPGVKITKILPDRIEFVNNRRLEYVELEGVGAKMDTSGPLSALQRQGMSRLPTKKTPGGTAPGGAIQEVGQDRFVVDRAEVENAMGNIDKLFTQIRAVPQAKGGLKLLSVRRGSFFAKLGLRRNDVLERINGQPMNLKQGMQLFNQLKDSDQISIDLLRNGQKKTLEYEIR